MFKKMVLIIGGFCFLYFSLAMTPVQAEHVSVPAAAFKGSTGSTDYQIVTTRGFWYKGTPAHYVVIDGSPGKLIAPVNFPIAYGAVTQLRARFFDSTNTGRILLRLIRVDLTTGEWKEVYKVNTGKSAKRGPMTKTDSKGAHTKIDNSRYAWFLEADFSRAGLELGLYSVRIEFI